MNTKFNAHPPLRKDIVESAIRCNDPVATAQVLETITLCDIEVSDDHRQILNDIVAQRQTKSWFERFASL